MSQYVTKIRTDVGDLQIDYNALANLPTLSNPNLLINSDFRNPINQRRQTTYTGGYSIDRWRIENAPTVTVNDGSITVTQSSSATYTGRFKQFFEFALPADVYTVSIKVLNNTHNVSVAGFGTIPAGFTGVFTGTSVENTVLSELTLYIAIGGSIELEWIKLERGDIATAFSPRPYGEEVVLCKRFFQSVNLYWRPGVVNSAGTVISFVADVLLRTLPSGTPSVTLYEVPTRIRTTSSNSVDTTLTFESVYLANGMVVLNIASSTALEARSMAVPIDGFKVFIDAEIY